MPPSIFVNIFQQLLPQPPLQLPLQLPQQLPRLLLKRRQPWHPTYVKLEKSFTQLAMVSVQTGINVSSETRTSMRLIFSEKDWLHSFLPKKEGQVKSILTMLNAPMIITQQTMEELFVNCTAAVRVLQAADGSGEITLKESVFQRINAMFHWTMFTGDR